MNAKDQLAHVSRNARSAAPRVYEVHEFINLKRGDGLVQVRHFRTSYHSDGRISQEVLSSEMLLEQMIRAFRGYVHKSAGTLTGFFDSPENARECARAIALHHDKKAEVCGTQITIVA
jgi:hypothetical protein